MADGSCQSAPSALLLLPGRAEQGSGVLELALAFSLLSSREGEGEEVVVDGLVVVGVDGNRRRRWGSLYSGEPLYTRGTGTPTSSSARRWWATPSSPTARGAHRAASRGPGSRSLFASPSS